MPPLPISYFAARDQFRAAAAALSWPCAALPISARGPNYEELTIDVAWSTDQRNLPTLIISSGLHGVEGFFGAALQIALMQEIAHGFDLRGVRLVLIHALNPYGFAHGRRFDAENIDPNRNFLLPGELFAGAPEGYAEFDSLLNPRSPQTSCDWFQLRAGLAVLRHGMPRLKQAIAAGQYEFPQGLFFGGQQPSETQRILLANLPGWIAGSSRVVHFDLHSGLGQRGTAKLLIDSPLTRSQLFWLDQHLRSESYEASHSQGVAYLARGGLGPWCLAHSGVEDYLFVCAEFGTDPPLKILAGLRSENRQHHWGKPGSASYVRAKERLRDLFDPGEAAAPIFRRWVTAAISGLTTRAAL